MMRLFNKIYLWAKQIVAKFKKPMSLKSLSFNSRNVLKEFISYFESKIADTPDLIKDEGNLVVFNIIGHKFYLIPFNSKGKLKFFTYEVVRRGYPATEDLLIDSLTFIWTRKNGEDVLGFSITEIYSMEEFFSLYEKRLEDYILTK